MGSLGTPLLLACRGGGDSQGEVPPCFGCLEDACSGSRERVGAAEERAEEAPGELGSGVGSGRVEVRKARERGEEVGDRAIGCGGGGWSRGGRRREEEEHDGECEDEEHAGAFPHRSDRGTAEGGCGPAGCEKFQYLGLPHKIWIQFLCFSIFRTEYANCLKI